MKETPKEKFLKEISIAIHDFESATGVEVHNIDLTDRICIMENCDIGERTASTVIKLSLK